MFLCYRIASDSIMGYCHGLLVTLLDVRCDEVIITRYRVVLLERDPIQRNIKKWKSS